MKKVLFAAAAVTVMGGLWVWMTDTDVEGGEMPSVAFNAGEVPDVDVRGPEISTGEKEVSFSVPTVDVDVPEDDADGTEREIADDEGLNTPDVDVDVDVERDQDERAPGN